MNESCTGEYKIGSEFSIDVDVPRRWWEFWKPKVTRETRTFTIISDTYSRHNTDEETQ